jgi:hypothetical protein
MYTSLCSSSASVCADPQGTPGGYYVGHDEPSLEFKSGVPGNPLFTGTFANPNFSAVNPTPARTC